MLTAHNSVSKLVKAIGSAEEIYLRTNRDQGAEELVFLKFMLGMEGVIFVQLFFVKKDENVTT